jgi:hypothetical protein
MKDGNRVAPRVPALTDREEKPEAAKLDPALQGLAGKVVNGTFQDGPVEVKDGRVEVFVYVTDFGADTINSIKALGVRLIAERRSHNVIYLSIKVEDLEKLANLSVVTKVTPAQF